MANQVALRVLTRPGDDVIVSRESHAVWHETGGSAANAGVQLTEIGSGGVFTAAEFVAAVKPREHGIYPPTTLVEIENTHNRGRRRRLRRRPKPSASAPRRAERGIASFLDGARLWNAAVATGLDVDRLAAPFDLVAVSFSKGLGAPGGSLLAGARELIARAVRHRRMLGGAMRQVGIFAAAALHGLEHHVAGLREDHANARLLGERLARSPRIELDLATVQTNIVVFRLGAGGAGRGRRGGCGARTGVWVNALGARTIRALTHRDVTRAQCVAAVDILLQAAEGR